MNTQILESVMAKIVPAAGRNIRPPDSLVVILREVVGTFVGMDPAVLPSEPLADMQSLQKALKSIELDTDITEIQETIAALEKLSPSDVTQSSILYPIVNISCFKAVVKLRLDTASSCLKKATKSRTIHLAKDALDQVDPLNMPDDSTSCLKFRKALANATSYVEQLEEQEDSAGARDIQEHGQHHRGEGRGRHQIS